MAQDLGKISITLEGDYNSNVSYSRLDIVSYQGESYVSKINNNTEPITNTLAWQKVAEKGEPGQDADPTIVESKAEKDASNLSISDVTTWRNMLNINEQTIISTSAPTGIAPDGTEWIMYK